MHPISSDGSKHKYDDRATDKALFKDCMYVLSMAHTIVAVGGKQFSSIILRTMPLLSRKELLLPEWWLPRWWWQMAQLEPFELEDGPRKVMSNLPSRREEKSCSKSWSFWVSNLGQKRTKKGPSNYWSNTMTSSHWKMEKWDPLRLPSTRLK